MRKHISYIYMFIYFIQIHTARNLNIFMYVIKKKRLVYYCINLNQIHARYDRLIDLKNKHVVHQKCQKNVSSFAFLRYTVFESQIIAKISNILSV